MDQNTRDIFENQLLYCVTHSLGFYQQHEKYIKDIFTDPAKKNIYKLIKKYIDTYNTEVNLSTAKSLVEARASKGWTTAKIKNYYSYLDTIYKGSKPSSEKHVSEQLLEMTQIDSMYDAIYEASDILKRGDVKEFGKISTLVDKALSKGTVVDIGMSFDDLLMAKEILSEDDKKGTKVGTGIAGLDACLGGGAGAGDIITFLGGAKQGKAIADDVLVPTPDGMKEHGKLVVGDKIFDRRGYYTEVVAVGPKLDMDMEVSFSNGEKVRCHSDHEWIVDLVSKNYENSVVETRSLDNNAMTIGGLNFTVRVLEEDEVVQGNCIQVSSVDGKYHLTSQFIPTHNSSLGVQIGSYNAKRGKNVFHVSGEINKKQILEKYAVNLSNMTYSQLKDPENGNYALKMGKYNKAQTNLFWQYWPEKTATMLDVRAWISAVRAEKGVQPSVIIIDYDDPLHGDTKVSLLNGKEVPIKELVGEKEFWVYACKEDGTIVPGRGHSARVARYVDELVEIELDNGEIIKSTLNHNHMLRDGSFKRADEFKVGDSMMPLYRRKKQEK